MTMPAQKPGKSKQDYGTPRALINAVEARWGNLSWDLAATEANSKAELFITEAEDSFTVNWHKLEGQLWLNPPYANIWKWADKCSREADRGAQIIMLTPASVGSEWFAAYVHRRAHTVFIRPRLVFAGCVDPYPKDCMLTLWGMKAEPSYEIWKWK